MCVFICIESLPSLPGCCLTKHTMPRWVKGMEENHSRQFQETAGAFLHVSDYLHTGSLWTVIGQHITLDWMVSAQSTRVSMGRDTESAGVSMANYFRVQCANVWGMVCHASCSETQCTRQAGCQVMPASYLTSSCYVQCCPRHWEYKTKETQSLSPAPHSPVV